MTALDRTGIFKARPVSWNVRKSENSESVAIQIHYQILAEKSGSDWEDWTQYEPHYVRGDHWIVKKDGRPNVKTIETLAEVLSWDGSLSSVIGSDPPDIVVSVTVEAETYDGKTYHKVAWLNPENYVPGGDGASADEVRQLDAKFGSLLRAAARGSGKPAAKPTPTKKPPQPAPAGTRVDPRENVDHDQIPF